MPIHPDGSRSKQPVSPMYTALQAVQMMAYTTLEDRQENFPCGLGSGTMPACLQSVNLTGRFCTWPHRRERCQLFRDCSFDLVGFSQASPSRKKAGDKRQGAAQKLSAARCVLPPYCTVRCICACSWYIFLLSSLVSHFVTRHFLVSPCALDDRVNLI